ncbi:MAG: hypothetical protein D6814_07170 [Calditrichaeota bacterium]|nr:MAG: hypothetical protein D6814_07170 [Calditrichota bacterium]
MLMLPFMCSFTLAGCFSRGELSKTDRAKIDPDLQKEVFAKNSAQQPEAKSEVSNARTWEVIIRTRDVAKLKEMGIPVRSAMGNIVTASVTRKQILKIAKLPSVTSIELGSTNYPQ